MNSHQQKFESLFKEYNGAIFRHLYYRLGNRERAKELTQEVFMKTWQYLISNRAIEYEKAFLYTIANNLFVNEIRTNKNAESLDELETVSGFEPESSLASPEQTSEQSELLQFLKQLSPTYQEVLVMRYIDDMSVKDIAALLGEGETNVSMRIKRAINKLKEIYETNI